MKIILFDFDGVMVNTFPFCYRINNEHHPLTEAEYRSYFEGNINKAPITARPSGTFDFFREYTPELMRQDLHPELLEVIRTLAQDHVLIVVSSTVTRAIADFLERSGLRETFAEILGNDVEKSKAIKIQGVLDRYNIAPSETVLITDTLGDLREAEACGVRCIAVTWGYHSIETLQKGQPYKIVNHPKEILEVVQEMR